MSCGTGQTSTSLCKHPALGAFFGLGAFGSPTCCSVSQALQKHVWQQIHDVCNSWLHGGCVTAILHPVCCLQEVTNDSAFGPVTVSFYVSQTPHRAWHIKQSSKQIGPRNAVEHTAEKGSKLMGKLHVWPYTALVLLWLAESSDALSKTAAFSLLGGAKPLGFCHCN